jgi:hypothetical protein
MPPSRWERFRRPRGSFEKKPDALPSVPENIIQIIDRFSVFFERKFISEVFSEKIDITMNSVDGIAYVVQRVLTQKSKDILKRLDILKTLGHGFEFDSDFSVAVLTGLISAMERPEVQAWIAPGRKTFSVFNQIGYTPLQRVLESKQFPTFTAQVSLTEFIELLQAYRVNGYKDNHFLRSGDLLSYIFPRPELVKPLITIINRYPSWQEVGWAERLIALDDVKELLGVGDLITDEMITNTIFQIWQPRNSAEFRTKQQFPFTKKSEQQQLLDKLRNGTSISDTIRIRQVLGQHLPAEELVRLDATWEKKLHTIRLVEHPLHPWAKLCPNFGYEIETDDPRDENGRLLKTLDVIGHHMGVGGPGATFELSPGPFHTAVTAKAIFESWLNAEWLNLHRARMQTCHMNVALSSGTTVTELNHLMTSTALAYRPVWKNNPDAWYQLRQVMQRSDVNGQQYIETKGYSVVTKADFLTHLDQYSLLATAAAAYEQFTTNAVTYSSELMLLPNLLQYAEKCGIPAYSFELALIWKETMEEFRQVAAYFGTLNRVDDSFGTIPNEAFRGQLHVVFPEPEDHFDADQRLSRGHKTWPRSKRQAEDTRYLNLIYNTRNITEIAALRVQLVLEAVQVNFLAQLKDYSRSGSAMRKPIARSFYQSFPQYREGKQVSLDQLTEELLPLFKVFSKPGSTLPATI